MSASEKLKALEPYMKSPILQDNALAATRYYRALPQIVAVVEAAEQGRDRSVLIEEHTSTIEKVAWRVEDAQALQRSLAALEEALE